MAQKLILPLSSCQLNAGYKSQKYLQEWGFHHYGVDLAERQKQRRVYAIGSGTVVACGMDGPDPAQRLGNCIVIVYPEVQLPEGRVLSLSCRMFHLGRIDCKVGDTVAAGTPIGEYGSTGAHTSGPHLHIEFDTDVRYPAYSYGIGSGGAVIKHGTVDSSVDPCKVFWLGAGQSITAPAEWLAQGWMNAASLQLPSLPTPIENEVSFAKQQVAKLQAENNTLKGLLKQINSLAAQGEKNA